MNKNLLALAITATLVGCGGGDSDNDSGGDGGNSGLSGKSGNEYYLENALVCLDKNNDSKCDTEEVLTGSSGQWTLEDDDKERLLLRTRLGGQDGFEVYEGTTEGGYAVTPAFNLTAPSGYTFISPISTLVDYRVVTGLNSSVDDAESAIKSALGITQFYDISGDYISGTSKQSLVNSQSSLPDADKELLKNLAAATTILLQEMAAELEKENASEEVLDNSLEWIMKEINDSFTEIADAVTSGSTPEAIANAANIDMSNLIEDIQFSAGGEKLNNNAMSELLLLETGEADKTDLHFLSNCDGYLCYTKEYYKEKAYEDTVILSHQLNVYKEGTNWDKEINEINNGNILTSSVTRNQTGNGWEKGHYYSKSGGDENSEDGDFFFGVGTIGSEVATKTVIKSQDISGMTISKVLENDVNAINWLNALDSAHGETSFTSSSKMYKEDKVLLDDFEYSFNGMEHNGTNSIAEFALAKLDEDGNSDLWTEVVDEFGEATDKIIHPLEDLRKMEVFSANGSEVYVQLVGENYAKTHGYVNFIVQTNGVFTYHENTGNWSLGDNCNGCGTDGSFDSGVEKVEIDIPLELQQYLLSYNQNADEDEIFIAQGRFDQNGRLVWGLTIEEGTVLSSSKVGYNKTAIDFMTGLIDQ